MRPSSSDGAETWISAHPRLREMLALDVADSTHVHTAFLVYMDLLEVRNWHDVQIFGSSELHLIYLIGKEKEDHLPQAIVPTPVSTSYSHERIQQMMKVICEQEEKQTAPASLLLAVVESDSTIVYYKLTDGFVMPDPPDFVEDIDNKQWRKKRVRLLR
ncbi:tRNA-splicing endonuclease subunit Sen15 [Bombina bombina]|uniref:tRNA-splicing endonuclease subunit Sen15 n=1 Tax=Bombina bombina TaxID=8345 RepID=UPI00235B1AC9|nr:tRNA-splicing endonuclease subunit Sen15 [Bombina bombina]